MADKDDKDKVEVTLLTDVKVDNDTIGFRGETHKFGPGIAAMLVNNGQGVLKEGRAEVEKMVAAEKKAAASGK